MGASNMPSPAEDLFDLGGAVALVTGASSGLGWRFAEVLAAQGARVVAGARRLDKLHDLVAAIRTGGGSAHAVRLDVTDRASITAAFDEAEAVFGPVGILVNNAGIAPQERVLEQSAETWRRVMETNLDAVWFCAQEGARRMVAADIEGSIINISSLLGLGVSRSLSAYAVAKAGVVQLTRAMALELAARGVRVNAIAPGYLLTDINRGYFESAAGARMIEKIPMKCIGAPADLDGTLLLLASRAARFMTGSVIVIDGGQGLGVD